MEILFLGTAAAEGIPALFCRCETCAVARKRGGKDIRSRTGFLINRHLMIDITPDIMMHQRLYDLDLAAVDTLCITHSHTDHLNDADLCFRSTKNYAVIPGEKPLNVYANKKSCEVIRNCMVFDFNSDEDFSLNINEIASGSVIQSAELSVTALDSYHDTRENCLFYLVTEGEKTFLQINDSALPKEDFEPALARALEGRELGLVSMDCTLCRREGTVNHMGIADNIQVKKRLLAAGLADEKTLFFSNHFSHCGHMNHNELQEALAPHGIAPAYDGMIMDLK